MNTNDITQSTVTRGSTGSGRSEVWVAGHGNNNRNKPEGKCVLPAGVAL